MAENALRQDYVLYIPRVRKILPAVLCGIVGGFLATVAIREAGHLAVHETGFLLALSLIAFYFVILHIQRILDPLPGLILTREGLFDNATLHGAGAVEWDRIVSCYIIEKTRNGRLLRTLVVHLRDDREFLKKMPVWLRAVKVLLVPYSRAPVIIPDGVFPVPLEEIADEIGARIKEYKNSF